MASPSTVITLGYGSFGSVNLLPTLGYGIGIAAIVTPPLTVRYQCSAPRSLPHADAPSSPLRVSVPPNLPHADAGN